MRLYINSYTCVSVCGHEIFLWIYMRAQGLRIYYIMSIYYIYVYIIFVNMVPSSVVMNQYILLFPCVFYFLRSSFISFYSEKYAFWNS